MRLCFWLLCAFLCVQTALLYLYASRALRRAHRAQEAAQRTAAASSRFLAGLSTTVSNLVLSVDGMRGGGAGADASVPDTPSPPPPRVLGWGQNGRWVYCDVVWTDEEFVEHTERRYIARIPASMPAP